MMYVVSTLLTVVILIQLVGALDFSSYWAIPLFFSAFFMLFITQALVLPWWQVVDEGEDQKSMMQRVNFRIQW